ncbi:MAG: hypothetical protein QJR03_14110 [Sphaerobacter sp.]|nr:hypothetical protein [Sphaerobacter sp.]
MDAHHRRIQAVRDPIKPHRRLADEPESARAARTAPRVPPTHRSFLMFPGDQNDVDIETDQA